MVVDILITISTMGSIGSTVDRNSFYLKMIATKKHIRYGMLIIDFRQGVSIHDDSDLSAPAAVA
jgi:hypothetical protein